jgi:antitoxin YefM
MTRITYSQLRKRLSFYMHAVCDNGAPLFVSRRNGRGVVLISEDDYAGLMTTVHLLASPANAARLLRSISEAGPPE